MSKPNSTVQPTIPKLYMVRLLKRCIEAPAPEFARLDGIIDPCLLFTGATDQDGYGVFRLRPGDMGVPSGIVRTHRFVYWVKIGPFLLNCEIDHKCRRRNCCQHSHLQMLGPTSHARVSNEDRWKKVNALRVK